MNFTLYPLQQGFKYTLSVDPVTRRVSLADNLESNVVTREVIMNVNSGTRICTNTSMYVLQVSV